MATIFGIPTRLCALSLSASFSVAKSGILSRNLGILLSSWDVFGIFISKSQCRDFFGIFEKSIFLVK